MTNKQTINVEQSHHAERVKVNGGTTARASDKYEQQHTYTVVSLQGTTEPVIGEKLSKAQVDGLCRKPNITVNIKPKK